MWCHWSHSISSEQHMEAAHLRSKGWFTLDDAVCGFHSGRLRCAAEIEKCLSLCWHSPLWNLHWCELEHTILIISTSTKTKVSRMLNATIFLWYLRGASLTWRLCKTSSRLTSSSSPSSPARPSSRLPQRKTFWSKATFDCKSQV